MFPASRKWALTDDEIINSYLIPAREFVQKGTPTASGNMAPTFTRNLSDRIAVDGRMYPTTDSSGQRIHPTDEGIRNFWRCSMESKEWRQKLKTARTQEEFSALFDEIPEATGHEIRTEAREFFIMEQKMIFPNSTSTTKTGKTKAG